MLHDPNSSDEQNQKGRKRLPEKSFDPRKPSEELLHKANIAGLFTFTEMKRRYARAHFYDKRQGVQVVDYTGSEFWLKHGQLRRQRSLMLQTKREREHQNRCRSGGSRADETTIPLCHFHHCVEYQGINRGAQTWEAKYGTHVSHLQKTYRRLGLEPPPGGDDKNYQEACDIDAGVSFGADIEA